jgi:membrane protein
MAWRIYGKLLQQSGAAWMADRAPTLGAALAFYSAFALAPLLIIVIAIAGAVFGADAARGAIAGQIADLVGGPAAEAIQSLLQAAQRGKTSVVVTLVGVLTMLIGATTIVVELQDDLDLIWKAPKRAGSSLLAIVRARILSLGMILGVGFLLLVSLAFSAGIAALAAYSESQFPRAAPLVIHLGNPLLSIAATTVLFAMLYKWLPNVRIAWKDVWIGAFLTALLFSAGRFFIGLYLGRSVFGSAYGAAGALVVLLLWLYYSAQVFLFGAEFTCVYAIHRTRCRSGNA